MCVGWNEVVTTEGKDKQGIKTNSMVTSLYNTASFLRQTDALSEELTHLRKECRSQARKLEEVHHALAAKDDDENELRSKVGT